MNFDFHYSVRGEFDVEIGRTRPDGTTSKRRVLTACPNLITNHGMDQLGTSNPHQFGAYLRVGTGSSAPAPTDTALAANLATVAASGNPVVEWGDAGTVVIRRVYQFGTGTAAGNVSELGLSTATSGNVNTRALFADSSGNPVTITVLPDEQLVVTYRLVFAIPTAPAVFTTTTGPVPQEYTLTLKPAKLGTELSAVSPSTGIGFVATTSATSPYVVYRGPNTAPGDTDEAPSSGSGGSQYSVVPWSAPAFGTITEDPYVPGSHQKVTTWTWGLGQVNLADIGEVLMHGSLNQWQLSIRPRVTKQNTHTVSFTFTVSWSRG